MKQLNIPAIDEIWPNPILKFKDKGSESRDLIFRSVGSVCTTWEIIEINLGLIFSRLAESHSDAAQRAYGTISNTSGRKAALEQAAEIYYDRHPSFPMQKFNLLLTHYVKAASYRNKIIHGVVSEFTAEEEVSNGCFLVPSFFASSFRSAKTTEFWKRAKESNDKYYIHGNAYRYTHEDINLIESKFQQLIEHLSTFVGKLIENEVANTIKTGQQFMHEVRS